MEQRYNVRVKKIDFSLPTNYTNLAYLGGGSYGIVCSAKDSLRKKEKDKGSVAIKRIGGVFRDIVDAKRILREMKLLRHLSGHANVVGIYNIFAGPSNTKRFTDVYLVTPLYQSDMFKIIQSDQALSAAHARYFMYQILRGLKYIHSANIIHRDLKPANLLINSDCGLAICDFGLARGLPNLNDSMRNTGKAKTMEAYVKQETTVQLTHYVVTRWYRAPELLVENDEYGKAIDMWSVGCILGEILGRRVLFRGRDYLDQLKKVIDIIGTPNSEEMHFIQNEDCKRAIARWGRSRRKPWSTIYPNAEQEALNLLDRLLTWDPEKRITVDEALRHPYIQEYSNPGREPNCPTSFNFDFEMHQDITQPSKIRELMRQEMTMYSTTKNDHVGKERTPPSPSSSTKNVMERVKRGRGTPMSRETAGVGSSDKKRPNNKSNSPSSPSASVSDSYHEAVDRLAASLSSSLGVSDQIPKYLPRQNAPSAPPPPPPQVSSEMKHGVGMEVQRVMNNVMATVIPNMTNTITTSISNATTNQMNELQQTILTEMRAMEERMNRNIESKIQTIVDDVITRRMTEFERRLEAGEDEDDARMSDGDAPRTPEAGILNRKL
jgi:serine/threonine protein kinase